jgi:DNA-binding NarL/FixJ family response regulator
VEIQIIVAEAQPILREGLSSKLPDLGPFRVVAQAADAAELRAALTAHPGCVAIVDLALTGGDACEIIRETAIQAASRCVALSPTNARRLLESAMRAGAAGYVLRSSEIEELVEALHEVSAGRSHVSRDASRYLVDVMHEGNRGGSGSWFDLTRRECQVLEGIVSGRSCPELALELGISARTVERHRASVMSKLDIHKTAKLVRFAVREGLIAA